MKNGKKYFDPVNYKLQDEDLAVKEDFKSFLDHLTDVPASIPFHNISIDEAGIFNQQVSVNIKDILHGEKVLPVLCDLSMVIKLDENRGIHMSRIEEALFETIKDDFESLDDFGEALSIKIRERQDCEYSIVKIKGTYFHSRKTRITNKDTHDKLYLLVSVFNDGGRIKIQKGIQAYNMTACPCTKTFTKFSVIPELLNLGLDKDKIQKIIDITHPGSHTQRGLVTILIDKSSKEVTFRSLYEILDISCHLVYELLKRPDEHNLVVSALGKPQFTEDVVRDVAYHAIGVFKSVPDETAINIESLLFDSIHIHDVYTKINKTLGKIRQEIKK
jgi:MptA/FolE2 family GTP cyclohydrolase